MNLWCDYVRRTQHVICILFVWFRGRHYLISELFTMCCVLAGIQVQSLESAWPLVHCSSTLQIEPDFALSCGDSKQEILL